MLCTGMVTFIVLLIIWLNGKERTVDANGTGAMKWVTIVCLPYQKPTGTENVKVL
jgi:hypothetical protein